MIDTGNDFYKTNQDSVMTAGELIELLRKVSPETEVLVATNWNDGEGTDYIGGIKIMSDTVFLCLESGMNC